MKNVYQIYIEVTEENTTKKFFIGETIRFETADKIKKHYNKFKGLNAYIVWISVDNYYQLTKVRYWKPW